MYNYYLNIYMILIKIKIFNLRLAQVSMFEI